MELDQALKESGRIDETEAVRIWGTRIAEDILLNGKLDEVTLSVLDVAKASLAVGKGFPFLLLQAGLFQDFERNNIYCQRRLNFDPLCFVNAKVNLTHPSNSF